MALIVILHASSPSNSAAKLAIELDRLAGIWQCRELRWQIRGDWVSLYENDKPILGTRLIVEPNASRLKIMILDRAYADAPYQLDGNELTLFTNGGKKVFVRNKFDDWHPRELFAEDTQCPKPWWLPTIPRPYD